MVVKDRVGRNRYVAFRIGGAQRPSAAGFAEVLRAASALALPEDRPRLVFLEGDRGLVRCRHTAKAATIARLQALNREVEGAFRVETLGTSGTIRRARRKYLEAPGPEQSE